MAFVARKPMTLLGKQYEAGDVVDLSGLDPRRRLKLIDQRRVLAGPRKTASSGKKRARKARSTTEEE